MHKYSTCATRKYRFSPLHQTVFTIHTNTVDDQGCSGYVARHKYLGWPEPCYILEGGTLASIVNTISLAIAHSDPGVLFYYTYFQLFYPLFCPYFTKSTYFKLPYGVLYCDGAMLDANLIYCDGAVLYIKQLYFNDAMLFASLLCCDSAACCYDMMVICCTLT